MPSPDVLVGDRYRLVDPIADGGMASVWVAWDERLHRKVAVKQLHPQPGLSPEEARLAGARALREARITARLHHPHAVPVYDVVDHDGMPCLVMQYLPSSSVQALLTQRGPLPVAEVARMGREVAGALAAAHAAGIVHRDVKPANILIDAEGSAKLTDFGISHLQGDATLTSAGMVTGTPAFLAPEVARGQASDAASDVFALGATLYAALEGVPPYGSGDNPMAVLHRAASGQVAPPQRSGPLTPILAGMLALEPTARPTMAQVQDQLAAAEAAANDPGAAVTTERLAAVSPPPPPPPSTTVSLPAAVAAPPDRRPPGPPPLRPRPPGPPARGRGRLVGAAAAGIVLVAALIALLVAHPWSGSGGGPQAAPSTSHPAAPVAPKSSSHASSSARASSTKPASTTPPSSTAAPSTSSSTSGTSGTSQAAPPSNASPGAAVSAYYGLLPGDTDDAWARLTKNYQQSHANGRADYNDFWAGMRSVRASDVTTTGKDTAEATITYTRKNGQVDTERTSFRLEKHAGGWQIADSSVLSST